MRKILILLLSLILISSCKTSKITQSTEVPVELQNTHRELKNSQIEHSTSTDTNNTTIVKDSIYIYVTDSTKTIDRWHTEYKDRIVNITDTLWRDKLIQIHDTITKPVYYKVTNTVTKEVKYIPWYIKILSGIGIFCIIVIFIYILIRIKR